ncbi:single-stranded DNA-binding protein [Candidatus Palauibacter sp.]|uniref:single-stranded DNA-binding protein n=1 Tax=Candidatus Palauibacter sp. TaxID=3101350 RepID=UPI003CC68893
MTCCDTIGYSSAECFLVGNAGSDPDVRETTSGTPVAHLSLATNRIFRANGETRRRTDWHRLTFWRKQAETVGEYVRKGSRLYVEGHLEYGSFERDGIAIPTVDVVVEDLVMLDPRPGGSELEAENAELPA